MSKSQEAIDLDLSSQGLDCNTHRLLDPDIDTPIATKLDVEHMIRDGLLKFHEALIERGQIKPIPENVGPKVTEP